MLFRSQTISNHFKLYGKIKGRNFREFMDQENAASAFKRFNHIYQSGEGITDIVWEIIRKDGRKRIIELSANLIVENDGRKGGFRGIARDVTEKNLAQRKALESEELAQCQYEASRRAEQRYRAFLNFLPEPVFVFNLDGSVSYLNPAFEKVFGWTLAELKGKRIPFVPESHKDQTREGIARLFREKVLHNFETRRLTRDGRLLDIVIDGALFYDEDNQPAGQVVTLRDVTQEKRLARINETLFRITNAIPHYRDLDGLLAFITRETQNLLDIESASVILLDEDRQEFYFFAVHHDDSETGKKFREIRFPADKGVAGHVYKTGRTLIVPDTSESPYYFKQVDEKAGFHTRSMLDVPIRIQDRMIGVLCAVNKKNAAFDHDDVDLLGTVAGTVALPIENARINQELKNSYEEVKSLNRAKDSVIHRLSHELKTPLTSIRMYAELLVDDRIKDPDKKKTYLQVIVSESQRLSRLVNNVLDFSRLEQGRKTYHPQQIDLNEFLTEVVDSHRLRIKEAGMTIETHLPGGRIFVNADRDAFEQVFINLIDNEVQLAKEGKPAEILIKLNSLEDRKMINKLYDASCAGVKIKIIVRGICCLIPGINGLSENIEVISIVDRFLEHSRIFIFHNGGEKKYFLSSADWKKRNLNCRIEVAFPVYDNEMQKQLQKMIDLQLSDNARARVIDKEQKNEYVNDENEKKIRSQFEIYDIIKKLN